MINGVYEQFGSELGIHALVDRFYDLMDTLPEAWTIRQLHPASLEGSNESLFKFLSGWFGGPPLFTSERGHPRLRMRHAPYVIDQVERDQWMHCMHQALDEQVGQVELHAQVLNAFVDMADHMINRGDRTSYTMMPR